MSTYLFDFDGTLVDSMPTFVSSMLRILDENHVPYGEDIVKIITPLGLEGTASYFVSMGIQKSKEEVMEIMGKYIMDAYWYHIPAKKNVIPTLQKLKKQGHSLNILTASPHITLDACMKRLELFELFDNVWSCDDFETTKADPKIYEMAARRLGVDIGDVLFLDDNFNADKTAKQAGMKVCGVYDDASADYVDDMKAVADFFVYDLSEVLNLDI